jgi:hypothetical protein
MLSLAKSIKKAKCRECSISENDREAFSSITHLQRYNPILTLFGQSDIQNQKLHLELPSIFQVCEWINQYKPNFWKAKRIHAETNTVEECEVYTKIIHLLNPIDVLREKYAEPTHSLLPQVTDKWAKTVQKINSQNNQAYIDYLLNFVLSRFREMDLTPHCVLFYGSFTGISTKYKYNISNEYDTYRNCRWFWDGLHKKQGNLIVNKDVPDELYNEIVTSPFENDEDIELSSTSDTSSIGSATSMSFDEIQEVSADTAADTPEDLSAEDIIEQTVVVDDPPDQVIDALDILSIHSHEELFEQTPVSDSESDESYNDEDENEDEDEDDDSNVDIDIGIEIPNIPVITIAQEAQEGIMDTLMDLDEIDGHAVGTHEWEQRWIAWLFQVISVLTLLQATLHFTHNDLHSNNILWRSTDKPYLYYSTKDGSMWRVPTYGKIFSIIDFGRAIFRLGKRNFISDDHWPDQDAGDQYNFGPFYDPKLPQVKPNMSFDLSRLSVGLLDGLFDETPPKGKGKKLMSKDGSWKVYETTSELFNLLWSWTVNDAGGTIYEDRDGNEKHEGFELYIRIAHDVHSAVPREQLTKPIFKNFVYKGQTDEKVYSLGI